MVIRKALQPFPPLPHHIGAGSDIRTFHGEAEMSECPTRHHREAE
jgi:hypothetical protein